MRAPARRAGRPAREDRAAATGPTRRRSAVKQVVAEFADDFGYDLDEDGQPTDDGDDVDSDRAARGATSRATTARTATRRDRGAREEEAAAA